MLLIAGIFPKTKILDDNPRICPACGLAQARLKRIDHYLSIFFIPVLRVKKGDPFIICDRCETMSSEFGKNRNLWPGKKGVRCKNCGSALDKDFTYCPYCGKPV